MVWDVVVATDGPEASVVAGWEGADFAGGSVGDFGRTDLAGQELGKYPTRARRAAMRGIGSRSLSPGISRSAWRLGFRIAASSLTRNGGSYVSPCFHLLAGGLRRSG